MSDPRLATPIFSASLHRYRGSLVFAGPFHRLRSPSQTLADDHRQIAGGMLWGALPRGGTCPTVQAYVGPLADDARGIEFMTSILPHQAGLPDHLVASWYADHTAFTGLLPTADRDFAVITIIVTRHQP